MSAADCARQLLLLIPHLMQEIRHGMRGGHGAGITVPQFRTLALAAHRPGASLSDAAAHVGLGAPAMSAVVEGLVRRGLLTRTSATGDRRRVELSLTPGGRALLARAQAATRRLLAQRLAGLAPADLQTIAAAVALLHGIFPPPGRPRA